MMRGNSDAPQQWKKDPSLGAQVCNQRTKCEQMRTGAADNQDPDRTQKLERLGLEWSWCDSKRKLK